MKHDNSVLNHGDNQCPKKGSQRRSPSAGEACASDDRRRHYGQLISVGIRGGSPAETSEPNHPGDSGG